MEKGSFSRREFIVLSGKSAVAASIIGPMAATALMAKNKPVPMKPILLDLKDAKYSGLLNVGGALKIADPHDDKKPIIVTRISETTCAAYSSKCTHWGCEVALPVIGTSTCRCHGSQFDMNGKVIHGPAKKDLKQYTATLEGTVITIHERADG